MKSESEEDYLKAIYEAQHERQDARVTTTALAHALRVSPASVTEMLQRLAAPERGLVRYERYRGVSLTEAGEKAALEVVRHHRLIESFLSAALGYTWDKVHAEAHRLEHAISEELEERMASYLGEPARSTWLAHPGSNGAIEALDDVRLTDLPLGQPARVVRVLDDDPEFLRYLADLGLILGARLEVTEQLPFEGPRYVQLFETGAVHALGPGVTDRVFVVLDSVSRETPALAQLRPPRTVPGG